MKLKVCGLKNASNINDISSLDIDYIGLIFYSKSPRYILPNLLPRDLNKVKKEIKKVGVFVNEKISTINKLFKEYRLDYVQLHGNESYQYCFLLKSLGIPIIKAFSINKEFDFSAIEKHTHFCDFFLFDTKGKAAGGNGIKFNWSILDKYNLNKPFFLSGGISMEDVEEIKTFKENKNLHAIDINSRFEVEPGIKDVKSVKQFNSLVKEFEYAE